MIQRRMLLQEEKVSTSRQLVLDKKAPQTLVCIIFFRTMQMIKFVFY